MTVNLTLTNEIVKCGLNLSDVLDAWEDIDVNKVNCHHYSTYVCTCIHKFRVLNSHVNE